MLSSSPVPKKNNPIPLSFPEAIAQVIEGKKITKLEWNNDKIYGILVDNILCLHKEDNIFYPWTLNDGDLKGIDWIVLQDLN